MAFYDWFRVRITENSIIATSFLNNDEVSDVFMPPFNDEEIELMLARIEKSIGDSRSIGHEYLKNIGEKLYSSIFSKKIENYFKKCLGIAKRGLGLRIELIAEPPSLKRLPWELMHDGRDFLSLSTSTPIVRTIDSNSRTLPSLPFPLGILFVIADPVDPIEPHVLPRVHLNMGGEIRRVCIGVSDAVKEGLIHLKCIRAKKFLNQSFIDDIDSKRISCVAY